MFVLKICSLFLTIALVHGKNSGHGLSQFHQRDGNPKPSDIYRLPNKVIPVSYELRMVPDLENFTFRGEVDIIVRAIFTTDRIDLHSKGLYIENVTVDKLGPKSNSIQGNEATYELDEKNEILTIVPDQNFDFNTDYKLSITFEGVLVNYENDDDENDAYGFYRTSYKVNNKTRWLATTFFEPTGARSAFPCFDEPRYRTPFIIHVAHNKHQIAISNMPKERTLISDSNKDLIWEQFQPTPPMPTYLVSFMVSDFRILKSEDDERIRAVVRPNGIQRSTYALKQAARLIKHFEGYFGIPYTLPKLDLVGVPHFPTGMENWGMIVINEANIILKNNDSETSKRDSVNLFSHELSHLWFGDLVTPAWYDYLWIKEGFATYFESFGTAAIEPSWNEDQIFVVEVVQPSLNLYEDRSKSMTRPIRKYHTISSSFDGISYIKAGSVIRMFELMLSSATFQNALHLYLKDGQQNEKGVAVQRNLFDAFDKQVELDSISHLPPHVSASDIMKTWSENAGYPLIEVTRSYDTGKVIITQTPFQSNNTGDPYHGNEKWIIPLTYTTKSKLDFNTTLPKHWSLGDKPLVLCGLEQSDWILFNIQHSGYYRVNYDPTNWDLLIDQLLRNHTEIHVLNRAQLINDAISLAFFSKIPFSVVARMLEYLANETNIIPWYSASAALLQLMDISRYDKRVEEDMQKNFQNILAKGIRNFGCNILPSDDHMTKVLKPRFLNFANKLGLKDCINELLLTYQNNRQNLNEIQPDLKSAVLCNALRHSPQPQTVYEHLWDTYTKTIKFQEKKQIMESIFSCANDTKIIKNVLMKIFDSTNTEISEQDKLHVVKSLITEVPTVTASIEFIDENIIPIQTELDDAANTLLENLQASISANLITNELEKMYQELKLKLSTDTSSE